MGVLALAVLLESESPREHPLREVDSAPSLEALFEQHAPGVLRLVSRLLGPGASRADTEDLTQQVFLAAHRALPHFRNECKVSTWLYGIATRTVYREIRGWTRRRRMLAAFEAMLAVGPTAYAAHDETLARRQELARVWRALLTLSAKKRVVLILHDIEGFSGVELAEMLETKEATIHTRLYHARRDLLAALEKEPP